jgi:hypothetical protein
MSAARRLPFMERTSHKSTSSCFVIVYCFSPTPLGIASTMTRLVWQRHPRYTLGVLLVLVVTFYFLSPYYETSQPLLAPPPTPATYNDHDLPARMERAERIYNKILHNRQGLIHKFGPTPSDVVMSVFFLIAFQLRSTIGIHFICQVSSRQGSVARLYCVYVTNCPSVMFTRLISVITGDFFPPAFNCPHEVERIGALGDGGKWICGLSRLAEKPDCIVYAFGKSVRLPYISFN